MSSTQIKQIFQSFILVPFLATSLSVSAFSTQVDQALTAEIQNEATAELQAAREEKAKKIDTYFTNNKMPLAGYGMKMVLAAEKNNLDWRLIPAIAIRESTGGKFACKSVTYSPFGYGSCKLNFKSYDHAIEVVATSIGGNNPRTASYYKNKNTRQILQTYNPPSVVPTYADEVIRIMNRIDAAPIASK